MHPEQNNINWQKALEAANKARRCGAKTRRTIHPCKSPAMPNGRCRMHGGKSPGAPHGTAHGRYKHGRYTREVRQSKRETLEYCRLFSSIFPKPKASTHIDLEDIGFDFPAIQTQADVAAALDEIWGALNEQELSIQEVAVLQNALMKKREFILNAKISELLKLKHKIEMT